MNEIFFIVEDAPEGGYTAKALGESIYTDGDNLEELHANVQDAVRCHFDEEKKSSRVRCAYHWMPKGTHSVPYEDFIALKPISVR